MGYVRGGAGKKKVKLEVGGELMVYGILPVQCGSLQSQRQALKAGAGADIRLKIQLKILFLKISVSFGLNIFPNIVNGKACTDRNGIYNFRANRSSQRFPNNTMCKT
eukprot:2693918-Rhodomonas_salina.2